MIAQAYFALAVVAAAIFPAPAPTEVGYLSAYAQLPTDATLALRQEWGQLPADVSGVVLLAVADCDRIGHSATLTAGAGQFEAIAFDCSGDAETTRWMAEQQIVAEIDYYSAQAHPDLVHGWAEITWETQ